MKKWISTALFLLAVQMLSMAVNADALKVAIDPGHQGNWVDMSGPEAMAPGSSETKPKATTGTQGKYSGVAEYELNLRIGLALREELEKRGYEVIMTREDNDTAISNMERAMFANENGADISVRIHANGSDDSGVSGALTMAPSGDNPYVGDLAEESMHLSECIVNAYCEATGFTNQGVLLADNMTGINFSTIPVTIVEMGYMSNEHDDLYMTDEANEETMVQGIANGIDAYFGISPKAEAVDFTGLLEKLDEGYLSALTDAGEHWAVTAVDLASDSVMTLNGDDVMQSASVIKVFIMGAVYERVLYAEEAEKEQIAVTEYYEGELKELLKNMITVSSNEASNELVTRLGAGNFIKGAEIVNEFCKEHGYEETHLGRKFLESNPTDDNYTSAEDCAEFLRELYNGTFINEEASGEMMALLGAQTRTGKIPAGVPETVETANKTGEMPNGYGLGSIENDIAIILDGKYPYILCVLSNDIADNGSAQNVITGISELVYEFFSMLER